MRNILTSIFIIVVSTTSWAQNTFPSSGNVGIGTISPARRLHVDGSDTKIRVEGTTAGAISLKHKGFTNNPIYEWQSYSGRIRLNYIDDTTVKTDIMSIVNTGDVGIGTLTPDHPLTIRKDQGTSSGTYPLASFSRLASGGGNAGLNISYEADGASVTRTKLYFPGGKDATFQVYNSGAVDLIHLSALTTNVGIGTTTPDSKLTVKGDIHAEEVTVDLSVPGPDYVFEENYELTTLEETENYIKANKHLPEIPSAKEMEEEGVDLGEMNMLLLKKIEELTLHSISQQKQIDDLQKQGVAGPPFRESEGSEGMNMLLLKKIEELTLHQIELLKRIELLEVK